MGICRKSSASADLTEQNREVTAALQKASRQDRSKIKLLLLGAGESGKSTIFKQMRILYSSRPVTDDERATQTTAVYNCTVTGIKSLVRGAESLGLLPDIVDQESALMLLEIPETARIDPNLAQAIGSVWSDPVMEKVWQQRARLQIPDSIEYFMNAIHRIGDVNYLATAADFLQVRIRTTGVTTASYDIAGVPFELYDVGGQRNERRKWIHCFEEVHAVIFVAALSEYDQPLFEDRYTNRMVEAIDLFDEVCSLKYFRQTSIILFLNKYDLFQAKLRSGKSPIADTVVVEKNGSQVDESRPWEDYKGGDDPVSGRNYFKDKFLSRNMDSSRTIYFHITTATDTGNIKFVFDAVKDIILEQNIHKSGF